MNKSFFDYSFDELKQILIEWGNEPYRSKQIYKWIYKKRAKSFFQITSLKKEFRRKLEQEFNINLPEIIKIEKQKDGTQKLLLKLKDRNKIESVIIPAGDKTTLCISSQVGCALDCSFCATGKMGFIRNLDCSEIVGQLMIAISQMEGRRLTNFVFMGMGEPLNNFGNVVKSIKIINNEFGLNISGKRITISSAGIIPKINELKMMNLGIKLAISLNASTNSQRDQIMPINKKYILEELLSSIRDFQNFSRDRITFEYVLLKGFNDTYNDAKRLISLLGNISCKINLIPYNSIENTEFQTPPFDRINRFANWLYPYLPAVTIRKSRGSKISAACGQLATE